MKKSGKLTEIGKRLDAAREDGIFADVGDDEGRWVRQLWADIDALRQMASEGYYQCMKCKAYMSDYRNHVHT